MVFGSYWQAGAKRVTWDPLVTSLRLDYVGLSGKPGWSGGSAWYGWYGPSARLGPVGLVRPWCTARPGMDGTALVHGSARYGWYGPGARLGSPPLPLVSWGSLVRQVRGLRCSV